MNWVDLVAIDREVDLQEAINRLSEAELRQITDELLSLIGSNEDSAKKFLIRLLLERARPMAIPLRVWRRRPEETWSVQEEIKRYLEALGHELSPEHVALFQQIYFRFLTGRQKVPVTEHLLRNNAFAECASTMRTWKTLGSSRHTAFGQTILRISTSRTMLKQ